MRCCVVLSVSLAAGRRAPGAALVEEHDAPERGIEVAAMMRQAAPAGSAVQEHERHAMRALPQVSQCSVCRASTASRPAA